MFTRTKIIGLVIIIFILILFVFGYFWFTTRQAQVINGLASPNFPYKNYSQEDLNKLYPQTLNENVATTQTPEQTFEKFIAAVKAGDFAMATDCCFMPKNREQIKAGLEKLKQQGQVEIMLKDLSGGIEENMIGDTKASYDYFFMKDGVKTAGYISFLKDSEGKWMIESL